MKDEKRLKEDEALIQKNGDLKVGARKGGVGLGLGMGVGALYGAGASALLNSKGLEGAPIPPKIKKIFSSKRKGALIGAAASAVLGIPALGAEILVAKKRRGALLKYPKSMGEGGKPGYTESYPEHMPWPTLKAYFKRPKTTTMSAREELGTIIELGKMEDDDRLGHKIGRVAISTAVGGIGGRALAWRPMTGGKMNRGTLIGASIAGVSQAAAEHIAAAEKGIHGNPVRVKDESRKSTRDVGGTPAAAILAGGILAANVRKRVHTGKSMADYISRMQGIPPSAESAARQQQQHARSMGWDGGETFLPKMPKWGKNAASKVTGRPITVDDMGGNLEAKLERLARRAKGTPEGVAAAKKLQNLRDKGGKTIGSKVRKILESAKEKFKGVRFPRRAGKAASGASKIGGLLAMSVRDELGDIIELGFRDEIRKRVGAAEGFFSRMADKGAAGMNRAGAEVKRRSAIGVEAAINGRNADLAREAGRNLPDAMKVVGKTAAAGVRTGARQAGRYVTGALTGEAGTAATKSEMIREALRGLGERTRGIKISSTALRNAGIGSGALLAGAGVHRASKRGEKKDRADDKFRRKIYRGARRDYLKTRREQKSIAMSAKEELNGIIEFGPRMGKAWSAVLNGLGREDKSKAAEYIREIGIWRGRAAGESAEIAAKLTGRASSKKAIAIGVPSGIAVGAAGTTIASRKKKETELSSRATLDTILFADPRPRDSMGMFSGSQGGPNPNAMKVTYDPRVVKSTSGSIAGLEGFGQKALKKIVRYR